MRSDKGIETARSDRSESAQSISSIRSSASSMSTRVKLRKAIQANYGDND